MPSWVRYAFTLVRGGVEAVPLPHETLEQALSVLDEVRDRLAEEAAAVLGEGTGVAQPAGDLSDEDALELQRLAADACRALNEEQQKDLRTTTKLVALEDDAAEQREQAQAFGVRLVTLLLEHAPLREKLGAILGGAPSLGTPTPAGQTQSFMATRYVDAAAPARPKPAPAAAPPPTAPAAPAVSDTLIDTSETVAANREEAAEAEAAASAYPATKLEIPPEQATPTPVPVREPKAGPGPGEPANKNVSTKLLAAGAVAALALMVLVLGLALLAAAYFDLGGLQGNLPRSVRVAFDSQPPRVRLTSPEDGLQVDRPRVQVTGKVDDRTLASLSVDGKEVSLAPDAQQASFETLVELKTLKTREIVVVARDGAGHETRVVRHVRWVDKRAPRIHMETPPEGHTTFGGQVQVSGSVEDVTLESVTVNGKPVVLQRSGDRARFTATLSVPLGSSKVIAVARDRAGNLATVRRQVTRLKLALEKLEPPEGTLTREKTIVVSGRLSHAVAGAVKVAGQSFSIQADGGFRAEGIALQEGKNTLAVRVEPAGGEPIERTLTVTRDSTPPTLEITGPKTARVVVSARTTHYVVSGVVKDASTCQLRLGSRILVPLREGGRFGLTVTLPLHARRIVLVLAARDAAGNETQVKRTFVRKAARVRLPRFQARTATEVRLVQQARSGDTNAMVALGTLCGLRRQHRSAAAWYRAAATRGNPMGHLRLGVAYAQGRGVGQSYGRAFQHWQQAAQGRNPYCWAYYGHRLLRHRKDAEGKVWIEKACKAGHWSGFYYRGEMHENGRLVPRDLAAALKDYRKARTRAPAEKNIHGELDKLINRLEVRVRRVPPVVKVKLTYVLPALGFAPAITPPALTRLKAKAAAEDPKARTELGLRYAYGLGVTKDEKKGFGLCLKAALAGHAPAMTALGRLYMAGVGHAPSLKRAEETFTKVVDTYDDPQAMVCLGVVYLKKKGKLNHQRARQWFNKAGKAKEPTGWANLALMYEAGLVESRTVDAKKMAYRYHKKAAALGLKASQEAVQRLLRENPDLGAGERDPGQKPDKPGSGERQF